MPPKSFLAVISSLLVCGAMLGQSEPPGATQSSQKPPLPEAPSASQPTMPQPKPPKDGGSNTRMFGVVPQFSVVDASITEPLAPNQKWRLFLRSNTDPFVFVSAGLTAGISQAQNGNSGYGQGAAGFGKRYGAALADQVDGGLWGTFILPVILKEDPRYFRKGQGSIRSRAWYSFSRVFVTRTDKGTTRFNNSNIFGNLISGAISNAYYPKDDRGVGQTLTTAAVVTLMGSIAAEGEEFWPDIDCHVIHRKRCRDQKAAAAAAISAPKRGK